MKIRRGGRGAHERTNRSPGTPPPRGPRARATSPSLPAASLPGHTHAAGATTPCPWVPCSVSNSIIKSKKFLSFLHLSTDVPFSHYILLNMQRRGGQTTKQRISESDHENSKKDPETYHTYVLDHGLLQNSDDILMFRLNSYPHYRTFSSQGVPVPDTTGSNMPFMSQVPVTSPADYILPLSSPCRYPLQIGCPARFASDAIFPFLRYPPFPDPL